MGRPVLQQVRVVFYLVNKEETGPVSYKYDWLLTFGICSASLHCRMAVILYSVTSIPSVKFG